MGKKKKQEKSVEMEIHELEVNIVGMSPLLYPFPSRVTNRRPGEARQAGNDPAHESTHSEKGR